MRISNKLSHTSRSRLANRPGTGDAPDPRLTTGDFACKVPNRKALQLCAQVRRTLCSVLAGECDDDILRDLFVESVVPAPNAGRLLVTVYAATLGNSVPPLEILAHLHKAAGFLRREVAASIHRRKVPELIFQVWQPL